MHTLSIGKARGLAMCANARGIFNVLALDHRESLAAALAPEDPSRVTYQQMVSFKLTVMRALAPHASAIVLDPVYSAAKSIATRALPANVGLIVALEQSGYVGEPTARTTQLLEGWSVAKVRRMGASGVKLLIYYHPDAGDLAIRQEALVRQVAKTCVEYDIPLFLEPITYSLDPDIPKDSTTFAQERPHLVVETARRLGELRVDVLKLEFPVDVTYETDESTWVDTCREVSAASRVPWILLSADVDFEMFDRQVRAACEGGASGYLAGSAVWKELTTLLRGEREMFLEDVAPARLQRLEALANQYACPWWDFWPGLADSVGEGWYKTYANSSGT